MPNEDLFMGLNRYTKYFLFLREAYTNAPIYFILFYFILFYFCRQGSRGKDANNEKSYFLFIFVKKELKGKVGITKKPAVNLPAPERRREAEQPIPTLLLPPGWRVRVTRHQNSMNPLCDSSSGAIKP